MKKNPAFAKDNLKTKIAVLVGLFCFLYIVFSFRPLGTELHLTPDWTLAIDREELEAGGESAQDLVPFKLGQAIGYFSADGRIAACIPFSFNAAISSRYYAVYSANNKGTEVKNPDGTTALTLDAPGFPFFSDDRIFLFLPNGNSIARYDSTGAKLWEYENYAPVSAFSSSEGGCVIGFADGQIVSVKNDGTIDQRYYPGGSEFSAIYGAAVSTDGSLIACMSGLKQQRFIVSRRNQGEHPKVIFHEYLPAESNQLRLVKFNEDASLVFYNYNGGLGVADLQGTKSSHIPLSGTVVQIEEAKEFDLVFILSRDGKKYTVTVLEPFDQVLSSTSFKAEHAFLLVRDNYVFIGRDSKISRISIAKR
ncbi:MAG: hypothetical protein J6Y13_08750 [Treponema sp.]|nr:hypothetical protein [Treponema sp.]